MAYVPLNSLWINLWKLWIAFDARVVAKAVLTGQLSRPGIVTGLIWSGDPGVLPVRHSVERARAAT